MLQQLLRTSIVTIMAAGCTGTDRVAFQVQSPSTEDSALVKRIAAEHISQPKDAVRSLAFRGDTAWVTIHADSSARTGRFAIVVVRVERTADAWRAILPPRYDHDDR
jgi:hypothetical protein